ncbi:HAD family hydrolase [uncultured Bacteroides sp.]|uniref:HAD family hydrolase n=1 Tax=uncultured Bacteroides sp. TaxID=162156 RepID=UPI002AA93972|nr:HAD family hydrolase [uncultured Bacteroides sp.]
MIVDNLERIKALAFDFGGTLDSPFMHWLDVYLMVYADKLQLPVTRENLYDSYVYAERQMESLQLVKPSHSLLETQLFKTHLQVENLIERGVIANTVENSSKLPYKVAYAVTAFAEDYIKRNRPILRTLSEHYTLLLVSNYYGNIKKIATDLRIADYFFSITDSTIEGVRKPDPQLWALAISRAGFLPEEVVVIGDSMKNDILPALSLGCYTVQGYPENIASDKIDCTRDFVRSLDELLPLLVAL